MLRKTFKNFIFKFNNYNNKENCCPGHCFAPQSKNVFFQNDRAKIAEAEDWERFKN